MTELQLSVAVCTCGRPEFLRDALESLRRQRSAAAWEVLVVDNTGDAETAALIAGLALSFPVPLRKVREEVRGAAHARNRALAEVAAPLMLCMDDDNTCLPGWLEHHRLAFADERVAGSGGRIYPLLPPDAPQWARTLAMENGGPTARFDFGLEDREIVLGGKILPPFGGNMALRVAPARAAGGFTTAFGYGQTHVPGEDTEIFVRLMRLGHRVLYRAGAVTLNAVVPAQITLEKVETWWRGHGTSKVIQDPPNPLARPLRAVKAWRSGRKHARRLRDSAEGSADWYRSLRRRAYYRGQLDALLGRDR